jgi:hypothetical protein
MKYMVDIDGTICTNTNGDYPNAQPILHRINYFNLLFDQGHEIHYWTARGSNSSIDWTTLTMKQLAEWGVKYTSARMHKPAYDVWIDDKAYNVDSYFYTHESTTNRT